MARSIRAPQLLQFIRFSTPAAAGGLDEPPAAKRPSKILLGHSYDEPDRGSDIREIVVPERIRPDERRAARHVVARAGLVESEAVFQVDLAIPAGDRAPGAVPHLDECVDVIALSHRLDVDRLELGDVGYAERSHRPEQIGSRQRVALAFQDERRTGHVAALRDIPGPRGGRGSSDVHGSGQSAYRPAHRGEHAKGHRQSLHGLLRSIVDAGSGPRAESERSTEDTVASGQPRYRAPGRFETLGRNSSATVDRSTR